jgi:hypothetical protein
MELLQEILKLLIQDRAERTIEYNTPLSKSEKKYVRWLLGTFSNRCRVEATEVTKEIIDKIMEELHRVPGLQLDCQVGKGKK